MTRTMAAGRNHHALGLVTVAQVAEFFERQPRIMQLLETVDTLGLPDCWIGAGLLRNAVWDELHGTRTPLSSASDVDVIYFARRAMEPGRDSVIEKQLFGMLPGVPWSVHNQARMHERNGDPPYADTEDALRYWPETATAIAARLDGTQVALLTPFGIEDLVGLIVRPTPAFRAKMDQYRARIAAKNWPVIWPNLTVIGA